MASALVAGLQGEWVALPRGDPVYFDVCGQAGEACNSMIGLLTQMRNCLTTRTSADQRTVTRRPLSRSRRVRDLSPRAAVQG
jgi:hypothetical protein